VFSARVKEETCSGFDDTAEFTFSEDSGYSTKLIRKVPIAGIESTVVQSDRNAAIAKIGQDVQGVFEAMVSETVGVVAEEHG